MMQLQCIHLNNMKINSQLLFKSENKLIHCDQVIHLIKSYNSLISFKTWYFRNYHWTVLPFNSTYNCNSQLYKLGAKTGSH